jgi:hypothetical protein
VFAETRNNITFAVVPETNMEIKFDKEYLWELYETVVTVCAILELSNHYK